MTSNQGNPRQATPEDLAYLAGIIDGEGTIGLYRYRGLIMLTLVVVSTDERLPKWLKKMWGGYLAPQRHQKHPRHKPFYRWCIYQDNAMSVIEQVRAHLKIKDKQARLAAMFIKHRGKTKRGYRVPPHVLARRERFKRMMDELNRTGVQPQRLSEAAEK